MMGSVNSVIILLLLLVCFPSPSESASKQNVLLIAVDDLNDWVGCLGGHPQGFTPNIDRLARRGTLFTNAHCQAPICNPSRTSVLYGLRPSTSGIYMNAPKPWVIPALKKQVTLPRWFASQGYHTACTGKLYHGSDLPPDDFDEVGPRPGQRLDKLDRRLRTDLPGQASGLWDFGPQDYDENLFQDHVDASWAIQRLASGFDRPFFLAVGFYRPHVPFYAPTRVFQDFPIDDVVLPSVLAGDRDDLPAVAAEVTHNPAPPPHSWFLEHHAWKDAVQAYLACIRWTDEQVGRLLDALEASPYASNTVIVLFSDHGFHLGEKDRWTKFSLWERSTHVPLIVSVPGLPAGQRCGQPVELLSIYPTLTELCDVKSNPQVEGHSLVPLLQSERADWPHLALTTHGLKNHAIRSERYRYIRYHEGSEELYDLLQDPNEWTNLVAHAKAPEHAKVIEELSRALPDKNQAPRRAPRR